MRYNLLMNSGEIKKLLRQGFQTIRLAHDVPEEGAESSEVTRIAQDALLDVSVQRRNALDIEFVTLDPASSTDLDQAFAVHREGEMMVLLYAIADIGAFVPRGGALEAQAFERGVTVYCPDGSVPLYPRVLSKDRASLLPDGPRPAVLLTVEVDLAGISRLRQVERAMVRSRAKLAYENINDVDLSPNTLELANRIAAAEVRRGAFRVDRAEQEVVLDATAPGGLRLEFAPKRLSEHRNSALSLAANLAVATHFLEAGVGLFRVMDGPDTSEIKRLRFQARVLSIDWSESESLQTLVGRLAIKNPKHLEFCHAIRRIGGGASYLHFPVPLSTPEERKKNGLQAAKPWHAAVAASYAHATAPMRRLADRYVLDLLVAQFAQDTKVVNSLLPVLARLPPIMERAERRASSVGRESIDLVESLMLQPLLGCELSATILEITPGGWQVQIQDPAVVRRVRVERSLEARLGERVQVRVMTSNMRGVANKDLSSPVGLAEPTLDVAQLKAIELVFVAFKR